LLELTAELPAGPDRVVRTAMEPRYAPHVWPSPRAWRSISGGNLYIADSAHTTPFERYPRSAASSQRLPGTNGQNYYSWGRRTGNQRRSMYNQPPWRSTAQATSSFHLLARSRIRKGDGVPHSLPRGRGKRELWRISGDAVWQSSGRSIPMECGRLSRQPSTFQLA